MATATAALQRVRGSNLIDLIGLALVAILAIWLLLKFFEDPTRFLNISIIGLTNGAIYGLVALGYTLVYGILQLINFAHGDVFALSGLVASTMIISVFDLNTETGVFLVIIGLLGTLAVTMPGLRHLQRDHRAHRLQAVTERPAPRAADHGGRRVVHRPEHLARALWRRLRVGAELHPADGRDQDRRRHDPMGQHRRLPHRRSRCS